MRARADFFIRSTKHLSVLTDIHIIKSALNTDHIIRNPEEEINTDQHLGTQATQHLAKTMETPKAFGFQSATGVKTEALDYRNLSNTTIPIPSTLPAQFVPLTQATIDGVKKFVFFIGYPRSGHSIIGSFMDAHPNMIIAHEFPLFKSLWNTRMPKNLIFNFLYKNSYDELVSGWRGEVNVKNKGYSLALTGLWQATFNDLKVIGNKHGGSTVQLYRQHPKAFLGAMAYLKTTIKVPIHTIHVVRNPFDIIATQTLYMKTGIRGVRIAASEEEKFNNTKFLTEVAMDMLARFSAASKLIKILDLPTLELQSEVLIKDPVHVMKSICGFLGVDCPEYYLKVCKEKTFSSSTKPRNTVVWPQSLIDVVRERLKDNPSFQHYTFSD